MVFAVGLVYCFNPETRPLGILGDIQTKASSCLQDHRVQGELRLDDSPWNEGRKKTGENIQIDVKELMMLVL